MKLPLGDCNPLFVGAFNPVGIADFTEGEGRPDDVSGFDTTLGDSAVLTGIEDFGGSIPDFGEDVDWLNDGDGEDGFDLDIVPGFIKPLGGMALGVAIERGGGEGVLVGVETSGVETITSLGVFKFGNALLKTIVSGTWRGVTGDAIDDFVGVLGADEACFDNFGEGDFMATTGVVALLGVEGVVSSFEDFVLMFDRGLALVGVALEGEARPDILDGAIKVTLEVGALVEEEVFDGGGARPDIFEGANFVGGVNLGDGEAIFDGVDNLDGAESFDGTWSFDGAFSSSTCSSTLTS